MKSRIVSMVVSIGLVVSMEVYCSDPEHDDTSPAVLAVQSSNGDAVHPLLVAAQPEAVLLETDEKDPHDPNHELREGAQRFEKTGGKLRARMERHNRTICCFAIPACLLGCFCPCCAEEIIRACGCCCEDGV